ncbi:oxygen-independent coproporphyrinogen III oxidase [Rhodobacterales bacterium HKCCE3408]|nr:oxygen-independent coproporphyrinogen III oxidase [Rhodobacterales bacterium HKCCE3408]
MTQDALAMALRDARVPRYTSFPPANRFSTAVGPAQAERWLAEVPAGSAVSLYLHVPFCRRLCWFCACRTQGTRSDAPLDLYLRHLDREIAQVGGLLSDGVRVARLHLGGGTPTILSPERLDRVAAMLRAAFDFAPDAEVSVEIDPCDCDDARLDALVRMGLSRVSIGVQDFDPQVQAAIGREQGYRATRDLVESARARGVTSINIDLVSGLPYQTETTLRRTLDAVLGLRPERMALFGYAHVPWMARRQRLIPDAALPDPGQRLALAALARETLVASGYVPIGIDHFALPGDSLAVAAATGHLHRNFQGYTTDDAETLIGFGPSAISSFPGGIAQNVASTGEWQSRIAEGRLATARGHVLSPTDRLSASIIERLMCDGAVQLDEVARLHGTSHRLLLKRARKAIDSLAGIGTLRDGLLTASGPSTVRLLASYFDPGFEPAEETYSQAS